MLPYTAQENQEGLEREMASRKRGNRQSKTDDGQVGSKHSLSRGNDSSRECRELCLCIKQSRGTRWPYIIIYHREYALFLRSQLMEKKENGNENTAGQRGTLIKNEGATPGSLGKKVFKNSCKSLTKEHGRGCCAGAITQTRTETAGPAAEVEKRPGGG